jgi:hypothetical protein
MVSSDRPLSPDCRAVAPGRIKGWSWAGIITGHFKHCNSDSASGDSPSTDIIGERQPLAPRAAEAEAQRVVVRTEPAQSEWPGQTEQRRVELVLHRRPEPSEVRVNTAEMSWTRKAIEGCPAIAVRCARQSLTVVEMRWLI